MTVGDDPAIGLLRLTFFDDLYFDTDGIALEDGRGHADVTAEPGHAGAVNEPGLHYQTLGQRERQRAGRGPAAEHRFTLDVLHVVEEWLVEAAEVDEIDDIRLRDGAAQCAIHGADRVFLEIHTLGA